VQRGVGICPTIFSLHDPGLQGVIRSCDKNADDSGRSGESNLEVNEKGAAKTFATP
jgi:hypothetical protein